jgi:ABC-2 type transport system ATP-binding protein
VVHGLLGPNGAGKTTLLSALFGLVLPDEGTLRLFGRTRAEAGPGWLDGVAGFVETPRFYPYLSGRRNLAVLAGLDGGDAAALIDQALERTGLAGARGRKVKGYSLGMRQRLGLAAALLGEPEVLILDEPANGLDPEGVHWLRNFLRFYADQGRSVLVSSHLLAEIAQTVDNVVIIAKGRLVIQSSLADLADRTKPGVWVRTPQAQALRDALAAKGIAAELTTAETVMALETTTEDVGIVAAGAGVVIFEMTSKHFDLEEYFLELTTPTTDPINEGALR